MNPPTPAAPSTTTLTLPANASLFTRVRVGLKALDVLKDNAGDPICGPLLNACMDGDVYASMARALRRTAEGRRLLTDRPTLQGRELDLAALERLPAGTLGHQFVRYFRDNEIAPFETTFEVKNDVDYLSKRYRETHDLFHVVTGYATDGVGEMELQAFVLGNLRVPSAALVLAFSTALYVKADGVSPAWLGPYLRRLRAAYRRGRDSRQLLTVPYETLWAQPVAQLATFLCAPREELSS